MPVVAHGNFALDRSVMRTMAPFRRFGLLFVLALGTNLVAQPTVEELLDEIRALKQQMTAQREEFTGRIQELQEQVDTSLRQELEKEIEDIVAQKSRFYRRPPVESRKWSDLSIFDALKGGLMFTGLFRSRAEVRLNNVDFNGSDRGIDDEGFRINGRFRLGFGAVLERGADTDPVISALTELQAYGTFANNTYFSFAGPGGVPLPTDFTIFREPFEQVGIYQGYLSFERLLDQNVFVKIGRQEMVYGSEFLLGNNSFYDGTVHDAIRVDYDNGEFSVSGFFAKEAQSDTELAVIFPAQDFDEDYLAGVYSEFKPAENLELDVYALYFDARSNFTDSFVTRSTNFGFDGALNPPILGHFWTLGARLFTHSLDLGGDKLSINAEVAYQFGKNGVVDAASGGLDEQPIHGWATEIFASYRLDPTAEGLKPIFTVGYYWAAGGEKNPDTANGFPTNNIGFQPLFINRHFTGLQDRSEITMPYFPGGGRYGNLDLIPLNNMHILKASVSVAPTDKTELGVSALMAIVADDEGFGDGVFGYEIDLFASYRYSDFILFEGAIGFFIPQEIATDASNYYFFGGADPNSEADNSLAFGAYVQALIQF